jgi:hypothetical protein
LKIRADLFGLRLPWRWPRKDRDVQRVLFKAATDWPADPSRDRGSQSVHAEGVVADRNEKRRGAFSEVH